MSIRVDQIAQGDEGCVAITLPINKCHVRDNDVVVMLNFYDAEVLAYGLLNSSVRDQDAIDAEREEIKQLWEPCDEKDALDMLPKCQADIDAELGADHYRAEKRV